MPVFQQRLQDEIFVAARQQLFLLQQAGAIPKFELSPECQISELSRVIYFDQSMPEESVNVWKVQLLDGGLEFSFRMDVLTHNFYQYWMADEENSKQLNYDSLTFAAFAGYLGIPSEQVRLLRQEKKVGEIYGIDRGREDVCYVFSKREGFVGYYLISYDAMQA